MSTDKWAVEGYPSIGPFNSEGEAMAAAWSATAPGEARPKVYISVRADTAAPVWTEYIQEQVRGRLDGVDRQLIRDAKSAAETLVIHAWSTTASSRSRIFGPWVENERWPLYQGDEVEIEATVPASELVPHLNSDDPELVKLGEALREVLMMTASLHGVDMDVDTFEMDYVLSVKGGHGSGESGRRVRVRAYGRRAPMSRMSDHTDTDTEDSWKFTGAV